MDPSPSLLAVSIGNLSHALEPGRDYLLGSADDCDLQIEGGAPHQLQICVAADGVTVVALAAEPELRLNGCPMSPDSVASAALRVNDRLEIGTATAMVAKATITADDGTAAFVPIPALRQAAVARRMAAVRTAAARLRRGGDETFQQLMADELRRAPWFLTSVLLHALLLLLLWWLVPADKISGRSVATVDFDMPAGAPPGDARPAPPEVVVEQDEPEMMLDPEPSPADPPVPVRDGVAPLPEEVLSENSRVAPRQRSRNSGKGGSALGNELGFGSGSFRQTVAELQESGLEIVFVFDSTGSMTRTIHDTKSTIVQMLDVLRALVPDARVGLVTYRDRGRREDYLVRQVGLDLDYWRASNFMQFVIAEGGGDRPEGVSEGLAAAFRQNWQPGSRRVVVLAGDAPPHLSDIDEMMEQVRAFASNRRSFVHALVTSPDRAGADTHEIFTRIAEAGGGVCQPLANRDLVLQRVLTLAFGSEFQSDIQTVMREVEKDRGRVDVESLHLARMGGKNLARTLQQRPVPTPLWNALVRRPRRATTNVLIDLLANRRTPLHTRHATAAALQVILELPVPPIDVETGDAPSSKRLTRLRLLADRLPE